MSPRSKRPYLLMLIGWVLAISGLAASDATRHLWINLVVEVLALILGATGFILAARRGGFSKTA
jgi:hypothetical protein